MKRLSIIICALVIVSCSKPKTTSGPEEKAEATKSAQEELEKGKAEDEAYARSATTQRHCSLAGRHNSNDAATSSDGNRAGH